MLYQVSNASQIPSTGALGNQPAGNLGRMTVKCNISISKLGHIYIPQQSLERVLPVLYPGGHMPAAM